MKPQGETKGWSGEECVGEAGKGWGTWGQSEGRREAKDKLKRKMRAENRNEVAPHKLCFLPKTGQLENLGMQAAVARVLGTRDAGNIACLPLHHRPLPFAQQASALHVN